MEDTYDIHDDVYCPKCKHSPLHSRSCTNWCDEGYFDESEDDPINFMPASEYFERVSSQQNQVIKPNKA